MYVWVKGDTRVVILNRVVLEASQKREGSNDVDTYRKNFRDKKDCECEYFAAEHTWMSSRKRELVNVVKAKSGRGSRRTGIREGLW